ncbi:fungal hydrophobin [Schizopora paradoxa]|uniref:Hydrophobin n=1 Tax=Schizopora paradoxa TaxID=27342 RepID=A0A0H2RB58_9AGAM|nr:fungal hydrophobin [Schizopora paradoxa]
MLFTKAACLALFPLLAVATPWGSPTTTPASTKTVTVTSTATATTSQCNTGSLQCCNSVQSASTPSVASLLGLLGIVVGSVTGQVGVTCSPLTIIGVSGNSCLSPSTAQPVCCENNSFNGVVALGCTPINVNL